MLELPDQPAWMAHAWANLGVHENTSSDSNPDVLAYYAAAGHPEIKDDAVAWCAAFVGACLERTNIHSSRSLLARSYLTFGDQLTAPKVGAIAVLSRGSDVTLGHVGFVVGTTATRIMLLSGNQSNQVMVSSFPFDRLLDLRWPPAHLARPPPMVTHPTDSHPTNPIRPPAIFDRALAHVLRQEGGYTDDPVDPGGPTNLGITLIDLASWKNKSAAGPSRADLKAELRTLTPATVAPIYLSLYWVPSCAAQMPAALALMHFDASINHGLTGAAQMLQEALEVASDGEIGPETLGAIHSANTTRVLNRYADIRRSRYRELPHFWRFGRGWLARVDQTLTAALSDESNPVLPPPHEAPPMTETRTTTTIPNPSSEPKWWLHSLTIWGTLITAASTVLPVLGPLIGLDLTPDLIRTLGDGVVRTIEALGGLLGTVMAITGRARATVPLARRPINVMM
jgi:uncharacterized protein (TIGR02594 family)